MTTPKVRVGVFGVGSLGQHHARIYAGMANADFVGVFDADPARAKQIADQHGTRAFASADELASAIDAASIAVPTQHHLDTGRRLIAHNVHVLVEKPIALTTAEAEILVKLASEKNLLLQVGHVERFNPVMAFLEEHLEAPRFIEAIRLASFPPLREGAPPRGTEVSVVLDLMIHDLEIILHLVRSPVTDIRAVGVPVLSPTEDIANIRLAFQNGCVANVTASRISAERLRKIRVFQSDSYVSLNYMNQEGQLSHKTATGITTTAVPIQKGEPLVAELTSFINCVRTHREPVVTGRQASDALRLAVDICRVIRDNPS